MLENQWLVVVTNPQREGFVAERLQDLAPYLPRFKNLKGRIAPLFPSYLFVPVIEHWGPICSTVGVRAVLMAGDAPARLPAKVIASWKAKEKGGLIQLPPPPRFRIGEKLTIMRGSLKYREVIYAGMCGKDRERVLIDMLGGQVTLTVPTQDLVSEFERPTRNRLRFSRETFNRQNRAQKSGAHSGVLCRSF
jgi:transcriptional antiterminator RfaH